MEFRRLGPVLFTADLFEGIRAGAITCAFRRWRRPTVKTGGTLTTALGVLAIDSVEQIEETDITDSDARAAGADNSRAVLDSLPAPPTDRSSTESGFTGSATTPESASDQGPWQRVQDGT